MVSSENRIYKKTNLCHKIFLSWKLLYSDFDKISYDTATLVYCGPLLGTIIWHVQESPTKIIFQQLSLPDLLDVKKW